MNILTAGMIKFNMKTPHQQRIKQGLKFMKKLAKNFHFIPTRTKPEIDLKSYDHETFTKILKKRR